MSKLICADSLIDALKIMSTKNDSVVWEQCISIVESLPNEEKHGHWEDKYNDGDWHCSVCGAIVEKDEQNRHNWNRCYHCGAKMDEVTEC